jgi:hypothetical protein
MFHSPIASKTFVGKAIYHTDVVPGKTQSQVDGDPRRTGMGGIPAEVEIMGRCQDRKSGPGPSGKPGVSPVRSGIDLHLDGVGIAAEAAGPANQFGTLVEEHSQALPGKGLGAADGRHQIPTPVCRFHCRQIRRGDGVPPALSLPGCPRDFPSPESPILDKHSQESLTQYAARPAVSLKKVHYEPTKGRVFFHTHYSDYFKENMKMFDALDFIAELTQHIPPKRIQLIRRYGLYASRTRGIWKELPGVIEHAPEKWKQRETETNNEAEDSTADLQENEIDHPTQKQAWARLLAKVYEIDPMICPHCGGEMKIIAVIQDTKEIKKIISHLIKIGRAPPGIRKADFLSI